MTIIFFSTGSIICIAQNTDSNEDNSDFHTMKGFRHGISFFKKTHYQETKPLKEGELDFKHYHTNDEIVYFLKKWAEEYPDLIDLYIGGKSYEERNIYQVTLTNKKTLKTRINLQWLLMQTVTAAK